MGDFPAGDLRNVDGLYPHLEMEPCAGCGGELADDDRAYANFSHIWHSGCWPKVLTREPDGGEGAEAK